VVATTRHGFVGGVAAVVAGVALALPVALAPAATRLWAGTEATPEQVVIALDGAFGLHTGRRRNLPRSTCMLGSFTGAGTLGAYSSSPLFAGAPVPVVARFSLAGDDPDAADTEKSPRAMALEFRLPDGRVQHMTLLDTPTFYASLPRTFLDKVLSLKLEAVNGKPAPAKLETFLAAYPGGRARTHLLSGNNPPASYANGAYYGIHTFKLVGPGQQVTPVRWRFVPHDGPKPLSDSDLRSKPRSFLAAALEERAKQGPIGWDMWVTIGEVGDPQDDPTLSWPKRRKDLKAGTLVLASVGSLPGSDCRAISYDPLTLSDGVAPSNDPLLLFRSTSYGLSILAGAR
jgi:catalase